jgi:hypothetical protein
VLVAGLAAVTVANVYYEQYLWASFALAASVLVVLPSVVYRDPAVTLHWPVLALAVLPILGRTLGSNPTFVRGTTYLSVAAVALVLAVELDAFSPVRLTPRLAVVFVVLATMATAGVWAIVQWSADAVLATSFVEGKTAMMWDLVGATVAGVLAAGLFELYFREEEPDGYPTGSPERVS